MWAKRPVTARMFLSISGERKNNFNMDCTVMRKPSSQTLLDYSILSLAVSPELYGIIIVCTPLPFCWRGGGLSLLLNFQEGGLDRISVFRGRVTVDLFKGVAVFT